MPLSPAQWHARFVQQAGWSQQLRTYLLSQIPHTASTHILEIGCGTGAILQELNKLSPAQVTGLDIDHTFLELARQNAGQTALVQADAHRIPYPKNTFDVLCCHYLLLWVQDPQKVVKEMSRVTRPAGMVIALAEPDYRGRIDHPEELQLLGKLQAEALRRQAADPEMGRKLASLFRDAGLENVNYGILGGQWSAASTNFETIDEEWVVIESDLETDHSSDYLKHFKEIDAQSWHKGTRVLYVPTFYAWGYKK